MALYVCLIFVAVAVLCLFAYAAVSRPLVHGILIPLCFLVFVFFIIKASNSGGIQKAIYFKKASYCLAIPICFWLSIFVFGMVAAGHFSETRFVGKIFQSKISSALRLPNSGFDHIAVDSQDRIYCYSLFYRRMQLFDKNGQFLRGWFVDIPGGSYNMVTDDKDNLAIASLVSKTKYFFDSYGKLIKKTYFDDYYAEFGSTWKNEPKDKLGNVYKKQTAVLFPKVVKITPEGKEIILIKEPFSLWLIRMPFPGFVFMFASFLFVILRSLYVRNK